MKANTPIISFLSILLFFSVTHLTAQCTDIAQNTGGVRFGINPTIFANGNSFTPACTGTLRGVTFYFLSQSPIADDTPVTVELHQDPFGNNGGPTLVESITQVIPILQEDYAVFFDLTSTVTAGVEYSIRIVRGDHNVILSTSRSNPYANGRFFKNDFDTQGFGMPPDYTSTEDWDLRFEIHYEDTTNPVALCQNITRFLDTNNTVTIQASDIDNGSFDTNSTIIYTLSQSTFNCSDVGENTVTLTVEDEAGNTETCEAIVTILDTVAPVLTCPDNIIVYLDSGVPAIINYVTPVASEECAIAAPNGFIFLGVQNNKSYFISQNILVPSAAFSTAEALGGHLATIVSQEHNDFIRQAADDLGISNNLLIGYNDTATEGTFKWHSGSNSNYTNWRSGEPNNAGSGEDYTYIDTNGVWNDIHNNAARYYVIELSSPAVIQTAGLASGSVFPDGVTINTFQTTDASGNVGECSFTVTVGRNVTPVAVCQNPTKQFTSLTSDITITPSELDGGSTANALLIESNEFIVNITADSPEDQFLNGSNVPNNGIWNYQEFAFMVPTTGQYTFTMSGDSGSNFVLWDDPILPNSGTFSGRPNFIDNAAFLANGNLLSGINTYTLNAGHVYYMSLIGLDPGDLFSGTLQINAIVRGNLSKYISDPCSLGASISETLYAVSYTGDVESCISTITLDDVNNRCNPFTTQWQTTASNETITFPITTNTGTLSIDWGDGTIEDGLSNNPSHSYANPGTYIVKTYGDINAVSFNDTGSKLNIIDITQWGTTSWSTMESAFFGCANLDVSAIDTPDLSNVTSLRKMFEDCISLQGTSAFNIWDVGTITNMSRLFRCNLSGSQFNQNIGGWNVGMVQDMSEMFYQATNFNQNIENWNTGSVTLMREMFSEAINFNQNIGNWNVSAVTSMSLMFNNAIAFDQNIGNWDVSNVSFMSLMFSGVTLSYDNYDSLLQGWSQLTLKDNVSFSAGNSQYCFSETARQSIIDNFGWVINDNGRGCPQITVPNVVGLTETIAATELTNEGLITGTITIAYNNTVALGDIISQNPIAGASVDLGSGVDIVISLGPSPMKITGIMYLGNGGIGNAIELYVEQDIPDLSKYAIGTANNGTGSEGAEFYLSGSASAGDFIYLTAFNSTFQPFFGFAADFEIGFDNLGLRFDGDDAVELFVDVDGSPFLLDSYGNVDGSNVDNWNYRRGWSYRKTGTGPDGGFVIDNWRIPGAELIRDVDTNNSIAPVPFPTGTYGQPYDMVPPVAICQDVSGTITASSSVTITPEEIGNNSTDDTGVALLLLDDTFFNCSDIGNNQVTLTVYDAAGNKDTCTATVSIDAEETQVVCQDIDLTLSLTGNSSIDVQDAIADLTGACFSEGAQYYLSTTDPNAMGNNIQFSGTTTASSPTDDIINSGSGAYYESFNFTVSETAAYELEMPFTASDNSNSLLFAIIYDQPFTPNTGPVENRTGFVEAFVYEFPGDFVGSFNNETTVPLTAGTTYYMQIIVVNMADATMPVTASFSGSFAGDAGNSNMATTHTYTTADVGENTIYVIVSDDLGRTSYCESTVTVHAPNPFVTTWKTDNTGTSDDNTIEIPITGSGYNYEVDWGDGNVVSYTGTATHTYATPGTYTVSIAGNFPRMYFGNTGDKEKLLTIEQWGDLKWSSMESAFFGCSNLDVVATDVPDLSNVTSMENMFRDCNALVGNAAFNTWDVSTITTMRYLFEDCFIFNQNIDTWDVSNVTNMSRMFLDCENFNQDIGGWDVGLVEDMQWMLADCYEFNQDIGNWDTASLRTAKEMFIGAEDFNQNISNWNVSNLVNMQSMFNGATSFDQDLGAWDIGKATNMVNMFLNTELSTENYDNTLIGWATLDAGETQIPTNITFHGGNSEYCVSELLRQELIGTHSWSITDGGKSCPKFQPKVYLQGASLNANGGILNLMRDDLRANNLIPTTSPYDGITTCDQSAFSSTDEEAIVDWVLVELRDATDNTNIVHSQSCLIQKDGNIVSNDLSTLTASVSKGDYFVVIKHRNHLGIMSAASISLNKTSVTQIDFTDGTVPTYGTNAQTSFGMPTGLLGMWAGNVNNDTMIQYSGVNPDAPDILSVVLNDAGNFLNFPTYVVVGYLDKDVNMNGNAQYSGTDPDTTFILQNALAHPGNFLNFSTYQIIEQLPENE